MGFPNKVYDYSSSAGILFLCVTKRKGGEQTIGKRETKRQKGQLNECQRKNVMTFSFELNIMVSNMNDFFLYFNRKRVMDGQINKRMDYFMIFFFFFRI